MALNFDLRPFPRCYRGDPFEIVGEKVPGLATCVDDVFVCFVDGVGKLVAAQVLPHIFHGVKFGRISWELH